LGTMTFGSQLDAQNSLQLMEYFFNHEIEGRRSIDAAVIYNNGKTQQIIGEVLSPDQKKNAYIASKVSNFPGIGISLEPVDIFRQVDKTLLDLKVDYVNLLYLHWPDNKTPIEATLGAVNDLHKQGKIREFGLSNYPSWEVVHIYHTCKANGYILPTVYQGMYNAITRDVEKELFPALRCLGIKFYAYNPLAGGLLTGKHSQYQPGGSELEGRFKGNDRYVERYWKKDIFDALEQVKTVCTEHNFSMAEASLRWIRNHSLLKSGDAIIIGASNMEHLKSNLEYSQNSEKLPEAVVSAFDNAWLHVKPVCQQYWR